MQRISVCPVLELAGVGVSLPRGQRGFGPLISNVNLTLVAGEIVGVTGRSGAGKTTLARAIINRLPLGATRTGDIQIITPTGWHTRCPVAYIDQDAGATFNPVRRVGGQVIEVLRRNDQCDTSRARHHARELFERLALPAALLDAYPHELSGGQQQRAAIARAVACNPVLLIADEPGSALDVVTQLELVDAMSTWRRERGFAMLLISHDFALIHSLCDRVVRLENGRLDACQLPADSERCA